MTARLRGLAAATVACALTALWATTASAQLAERPGTTTDHPFDVAWDVSGRSIKEPRIRAVHDATGRLAGSSVWFIRQDPLLAYAMGRNLNMRSWRLRDGVFGESGRLVGFSRGRAVSGGGGGTLPRDDAASCATCHNVPFGELGAGSTIPKDAGTGRNTPHLYGAGLLEMIGETIRARIMSACDADGDGWIGRDERPDARIAFAPTPGAPPLDFGRCGDVDGNGVPDVAGTVRATYVDASGKWVSWATSMDTAGVAGWSPEVQVFGHGQLEGGMTSSLRAFFVAATDVHTGLQAFDPTFLDDPDGDGVAGTSPSGMRQWMTVRGRDRGRMRTAAGVSRDDPDRDGFLEELTQGDVDLAEHFLLHLPPPAELPSPAADRGRAAFERSGCGSCHVADWRIDVDRRLFRLEVTASRRGVLSGRLVRTGRRTAEGAVPVGAPFVVRGVYTDLRRHDLGPASHELGFDGAVIRAFRTPPLWGVGSSGPWGHDGASLSLEAVIARHGGEAEASRSRFDALDEGGQQDVLAFLRSLVLYPITGLPTDVDGDGTIQAAWVVGGRGTGGPERFDPELLATVPCKMEGPIRGPTGASVFSRACLNVAALYRLDLAGRRDGDHDGFPDLRDDCPDLAGYLDGCAMPANFTGQ